MADSLHPLGLLGTQPAQQKRDIALAVERYFQISLFLLIATAFITLVGTNRLDTFSVLSVSGALILRGYLLLKRRDLQIPEAWTTYFTLIYVLVFVVDLIAISGSYVTASIHLVLFSLVVKIFSIQRERDYVYLSLLAFLAVLAASVLTVDTAFLASFFIFILLAVNTFVSMEVRRSLKKAAHCGQPPAVPRSERRFSLSLSSIGTVIVLGIIGGSAALFFLLPRFSAGYLSNFSSQSDLVTGFGDKVQLGQIGRIKQSDAVVMHLQVEAGDVTGMKLRGVALTVFDGKTWTNAANDQQLLESYAGRYPLREAQIARRNLPPIANGTGDFRLVRYRVVMEPIGTNVIFATSVPIEVAGRFREIGIDATGSILNMDTSRMTESYEVISQIPQLSLKQLESQSGTYPPEISMLYLQLPALDPRVPELAQRITAGIRTDYNKAAAIEQYLRENYGYTLNLGNIVPRDPISYFLFERRQGHCEYFASSMAVMLRSLGIPSRIVNGFRIGEYNDLTGSYIIRGRDAHTWVEAYIPGTGWTSFDPTPPDPTPDANTFSRIQLYLDAAQEFWREWVINYDFAHQRELTVTTVTKAQHSAYDLRRWWRRNYNKLLAGAQRMNQNLSSDPRRTIVLLLVGFALVIALWNSRSIVRGVRQRSIARNPSKAPQMAATIWYRRMLRVLAHKGYFKQETQTPTEFVNVITETSLRDSVSRFTERYERARFGHSATDAEQLPAIYEEITGKK
jgi:transglutaminase-like putative cysteine protease